MSEENIKKQTMQKRRRLEKYREDKRDTTEETEQKCRKVLIKSMQKITIKR
jgi:hypothetical protein